MQWIPPNTIRVIVKKGRMIRSNGTLGAKDRLADDVTVDIEVSYAGIVDLARRACRNKSRRACDGPLTAKPIGKVSTYRGGT